MSVGSPAGPGRATRDPSPLDGTPETSKAIVAHLLTFRGDRAPATELIVVLVEALVSSGLEVVPGLKENWGNWKRKALTLFVGFLVVPTAIWALF